MNRVRGSETKTWRCWAVPFSLVFLVVQESLLIGDEGRQDFAFPLVGGEPDFTLVKKRSRLLWAAEESAFPKSARRIGVILGINTFPKLNRENYVKVMPEWAETVLPAAPENESDFSRIKKFTLTQTNQRLSQCGFVPMTVTVKPNASLLETLVANPGSDLFIVVNISPMTSSLVMSRQGVVENVGLTASPYVDFVIYNAKQQPVAAGDGSDSFSLNVTNVNKSGSNVTAEYKMSEFVAAMSTGSVNVIDRSILRLFQEVWMSADMQSRLQNTNPKAATLGIKNVGKHRNMETSSLEIKNDEDRPLLITLMGPEKRRFELAPKSSLTVDLTRGKYQFSAAVAGKDPPSTLATERELSSGSRYLLSVPNIVEAAKNEPVPPTMARTNSAKGNSSPRSPTSQNARKQGAGKSGPDAEKKAASDLRLAKLLLKSEKTAERAKQRLQGITEDSPGTDAAKEALELLNAAK